MPAKRKHPTEQLRNDVKMHAAVGTPMSSIARILGMSLDTLYKYYQEDIETGLDFANSIVGGKIFEAAKRSEPWACKLWASRRMPGWAPSVEVNQQTTVSQTNVNVNVNVEMEQRLKQLPLDQVKQLRDIVNVLGTAEVEAPTIEGNVVEFPAT